MNSWRLAVLYMAFAAIAICVNILTQMFCVRIYMGPFYIAFSIIAGTASGLVAKYILDKKWIFRYKATGTSDETRTFVLYTAMGLVTTAVFWAFEYAFHLAFQSEHMRYVGGICGLIIGYATKYALDKKYVFTNRTRPVNDSEETTIR